MAEEKQANLIEDEKMEGVAAGIIYKSSTDPDRPWEVLDDKSGYLKERFSTQENAEKYCAREGLNPKRIFMFKTVEQARANWKEHIEAKGDPNKFYNSAWD